MRLRRLAFPFIALIVSVGILLPAVTSLAQSEQPVIIKVAPETVQVAPGETTQFAIEIENARELYAFEVKFSFDPAVIAIIDANPNQEGVQVSQGAFFDPGFVIRNIADNETGELHFAMTQLNPSEAKSGAGILLVIEIQGETADTVSPLTITKGEVAQRTGQKLPTILLSGEAKVVIPGATSPTATPIPTQAPGTPLPTVAPTATADNSTPAPPPTATPVPSDTPTPQVTPTPVEATATPLPPTATPPPATPAPTNTSTSTPTVTPLPATATPTNTPSPEPEPTATPTAVVAMFSPDDNTSSGGAASPVIDITPAADAQNQPTGSNLALYLGLGLLALAIIVGVVAVVVWRRSTT